MPMAPDRIRFLHCADLHLDNPFVGRGCQEYSEMRRADAWATFEAIVRMAEDECVDFVLVCGDLYEHDYASRAAIQKISRFFGSLTVPVVILPGNHDPYAANSWYRTWNWPDNVIILSQDRPSAALHSINTFIHGIGFSGFRQDTPDLSDVPRPDGDRFNIFMLHGTLDMNFSDRPFNPVSSEQLAGLGYDYYALGHFHNRKTDFRLRNAANPGSPEPLGFDETGEHGVLLVTLEKDQRGGKRLDIRERNTARKRYVRLNLDMTAVASQEEAGAKLAALLGGLDRGRDLPRVTLQGRTPLALDCEALKKPWLTDFPWLQILDETRDCYDYEALSREQSLKGAYVRELLQRLKSCEEKGDEEQAVILGAALDLGIEALEKGRIDTPFNGGLFRHHLSGEDG